MALGLEDYFGGFTVAVDLFNAMNVSFGWNGNGNENFSWKKKIFGPGDMCHIFSVACLFACQQQQNRKLEKISIFSEPAKKC